MAWSEARQIYYEAKRMNCLQYVIDSLKAIKKITHRAQVALYINTIALEGGDFEVATAVKPYADELAKFKPSAERELQRFRDKIEEQTI